MVTVYTLCLMSVGLCGWVWVGVSEATGNCYGVWPAHHELHSCIVQNPDCTSEPQMSPLDNSAPVQWNKNPLQILQSGTAAISLLLVSTSQPCPPSGHHSARAAPLPNLNSVDSTKQFLFSFQNFYCDKT